MPPQATAVDRRIAAMDANAGSIALDAPAGLMLHLETAVNVNAMQIVLVDGLLDGELIRRAVRMVVARFPLLLSSPDDSRGLIELNRRSLDAVLCDEAPCHHPFTFSDAGFRRTIVDLSIGHPVRWRDAAPVRLWLLQEAPEGRRSCLLMTTSHATADAASDSLLLDALMKCYGELLANGAEASPRTAKYGCASIKHLSAGLFHRPGAAVAAVSESLREMFQHDIGRPRGEAAGRELDFYHEVLPVGLDRQIRITAQRYGHSITTVVSVLLARVLANKSGERGRSTRCVRLVCPVSLRRHARPGPDTQYRNFMLPCRIRVRTGLNTTAALADVGRQLEALKSDRVPAELLKVAMVSRMLQYRSSRRLGLLLMRQIAGTTACYSNPGIVREEFRFFGHPHLPIAAYLGVGCVLPPLEFILYSPEINGRIHLNGVFWRDLLGDFESEIVRPLKAELNQLGNECHVLKGAS